MEYRIELENLKDMYQALLGRARLTIEARTC